jgi:peptidoglycan/xylan/chitin deacetylase (PgdA/CDA1 family)
MLTFQAHLKNRGLLPRAVERAAFEARSPHPEANPEANPATNTNVDGQCGTGSSAGASCAAGYCCSPAGWCGQGSDYCQAPGCQFYYGPGCDQNTTPPGPSTSGIARPLLGSAEYGGNGIYDCVTPGDVALTYDDGPYIYTGHILDILDQYNAKATFFITGNNNGKGEIDNAANEWPALIKRMDTSGHHIASHTWSHNDLSLEFKTSADRKLNMYKNEMALRNILGKFPTYMRPPYSSCTAASGCEADLKTLGYHVVYFDLDTDDYDQDSPLLIQNSKNWFSGNMSTVNSQTGNMLVISHDIHQQTAYNLTEYMLQTLIAEGFKPVTLGECLGDPVANWYRVDTSGGVFTSTSSGQIVASSTTVPVASSTTTTATVATATIVSTTSECGGTTGLTCKGSTFGNCCSASGYW